MEPKHFWAYYYEQDPYTLIQVGHKRLTEREALRHMAEMPQRVGLGKRCLCQLVVKTRFKF